MGARTPARTVRGAAGVLRRVERRSWLSHGLAALGISALGLAVAGSTSLTTSAQNAGDRPPAAAPSVGATSAARASALPDPSNQTGARRVSTSTPASLAAFSARANAVDEPTRSQVRQAVVAERAAQRSEDLLKASEEADRAARDESSKARQADLREAEQATRAQAVRIVQERLRKAVAARVAAQLAREQAEAAAAAARATDPASAAPATPDVSNIPSGGGGASPVPGAVVGAAFGKTGIWARYHTGLDFRAGHGTPIRAVKAGVVVFSGNTGSWAGNHVAVRHADGMTTMSSHMSSASVRTGQSVQAGQVIGYVGSTGRAFGAHLHFELYPNGARYGDVYRAVNPQPWLSAMGVNVR